MFTREDLSTSRTSTSAVGSRPRFLTSLTRARITVHTKYHTAQSRPHSDPDTVCPCQELRGQLTTLGENAPHGPALGIETFVCFGSVYSLFK